MVNKHLYKVTFGHYPNDVNRVVIDTPDHELAIQVARKEATKQNEGNDVGPVDSLEYVGDVLAEESKGGQGKRGKRK